MKKLLPAIFFILTFSAVLGGQVLFRTLSDTAAAKEDNYYALYEKLFLSGNYQTTTGKNIEISKLKSPVVIYNFWASWCIPCMQEIPSMVALKKKFKDEEVLILAFNTDEQDQLKNIDKTIKKLNLKNEFQVIPDVGTKIAESFKFSAIPVTIIFNHGKVVYFSNGPMDFNSEEMLLNFKKWTSH